ncbi:MAG: PilZ domain-containing protein [Acidobacteriota bacterium]|nr:PilZ domain-containing protein [Acidobacteriota bacterium]
MRSIPRKLVYRRPRFRVDLPVVLHDEQGRRLHGRCSELSSEGAGLNLHEAPAAGKPVRVEIEVDEQVVRVTGCVVRQHGGNRFGLRFLPAGAEERRAIERMVALVQHNPFF